jgi:hypothetical protein
MAGDPENPLKKNMGTTVEKTGKKGELREVCARGSEFVKPEQTGSNAAIANRTDQGCRGNRTDSGNLRESLAGFILYRHPSQSTALPSSR